MPETTEILPPRYRGAKQVGTGGMGEIYRATDSTLGRAVAVKMLAARFADDAAVRERFTREALSAARLSGDPAIVTIFDGWRDTYPALADEVEFPIRDVRFWHLADQLESGAHW